MFDGISKGDTASVSYTSDRSDNTVSRKGTVLQTPGETKQGFFVQTDEDQLTVVDGRSVHSLTIDTTDGERSIERKTFLGEFESVSRE